jgi:hypothetical protein
MSSSSKITLAGPDLPATSGLAPGNGNGTARNSAYLSGESTRAPSTMESTAELEKKGETDSASTKEEPSLPSPTSDDEEAIEYPHGAPLFFVVVALVLSVFLVALDMVSCTIDLWPCWQNLPR